MVANYDEDASKGIKVITTIIDFALMTVDIAMTAVCVFVVAKDAKERRKQAQRRQNHSSGDSGAYRSQSEHAVLMLGEVKSKHF